MFEACKQGRTLGPCKYEDVYARYVMVKGRRSGPYRRLSRI